MIRKVSFSIKFKNAFLVEQEGGWVEEIPTTITGLSRNNSPKALHGPR